MDQPQKGFTPVAERVYTSVLRTIHEEGTRAFQEGVEGNPFLEGTLNALMRIVAFFACTLISVPETDPTSKAVETKVHRMQVALLQALDRIMECEAEAPEKGHA